MQQLTIDSGRPWEPPQPAPTAPSQGLLALREAERTPALTFPTIAQLEAIFLESLHGGKSPATLIHYRAGLRHFDAFLAAEGVNRFETDADALPKQVVDLFVMWLHRQPSRRDGQSLKPRSVALYMASVLALFKFATRREFVPSRFCYPVMVANAAEVLGNVPKPWARVDRRLPLLVHYVDNLPLPEPGPPSRGCLRLSRADAHRVALRDRALLHVLIGTGMRREEVARLNRADVEDGYQAEMVITGKGNRDRLVLVDDESLAAIRAYLQARGDDLAPLWLRHDTHRPLTPGPTGEAWRMGVQALWLTVRGYGKRFGIDVHPHTLRHSFASSLLNRGADIALVQELMGHSSPTVTRQVYAGFERRTLREGVQRYRPTVAEQVAELEAEAVRTVGRGRAVTSTPPRSLVPGGTRV